MSAITEAQPIFRRGDVVTYTDRQGVVTETRVVRVVLLPKYLEPKTKIRYYALEGIGVLVADGMAAA